MTWNNQPEELRLIPIYTTSGEVRAVLAYPFLYNIHGEWIGWVSPERKVFSVHGHYVGKINNDPRILRERSARIDTIGRRIPPPQLTIRIPAAFPLPPMMADPGLSTIDVLEEIPDLLPTLDAGELREDMD